MNTVSAEGRPVDVPRGRAFADRAVAAIPLAGVALAVVTLYCVEAWLRKTPWVFTDELEWTQISRSIQETGEAARRGEPIDSKTLYAWVIAPFWAIDSTQSAYDAIKYANAVLMSLAAVPAYLLARMLVPRRAALVVALLTVCIPAMAYVTSIVPEVVTYPWFVLASWLVVRALSSRRRLDVALAVLVSIAALYVRSKLIVVPAAFAAAAFWLWLTGPRGRALRAGWKRGDTIGAVVLGIGAFFLVNRVFLQEFDSWQIASEHWKDRMFDLGFRAALAFTVGMGVLPVIGGLASLRLPGRGNDPVYRAFVAYFAASIVGLGLYTATKAAYLSTTFGTLTIERNLFYLAPLMLIGTAMVLLSRELDWGVVGAAAVFVSYMILTKEINVQNAYFEAPGFSILVRANTHFGWTIEDMRLALMIAVGVSLLLIALRHRRVVLPLTAALLLVWLQIGQISMTRGINHLANRLAAGLPGESRLGRSRNRRTPGHLPRPVDPRPEHALADGVLEPDAPARAEPRQHRAGAGADDDARAGRPGRGRSTRPTTRTTSSPRTASRSPARSSGRGARSRCTGPRRRGSSTTRSSGSTRTGGSPTSPRTRTTGRGSQGISR